MITPAHKFKLVQSHKIVNRLHNPGVCGVADPLPKFQSNTICKVHEDFLSVLEAINGAQY